MRTRLTSASLALILSALTVTAGCDLDAPPPPPEINTTDPIYTGAPPLVPMSTATSTDSGATTTTSAADWAVLAGEWEGAYDAKKGAVEMPAGVKDPGHAADDGKALSGAGTVKITVTADGEVNGKSEGALGKATIRGKMDGKMLRASFVPDDLSSKTAMTGVLVGPLKDGVVQAELRVAGGDALTVRHANFQIKKK